MSDDKDWRIFTWVMQIFAAVLVWAAVQYAFKAINGRELTAIEMVWFVGSALVFDVVNSFFHACRKHRPKKVEPKTLAQVAASLRESQDKAIIKLVREGKIVRLLHDEIFVVYDR